MFFIVVDSRSELVGVEVMTSTVRESTIEKLRGMFARFGLPKQLISDNRPQFVSLEFSEFMKRVVDRRIYTRIFQFPLRINVKISEYAQNFNVFKPRLVCRRILILPSGSSGNSQKSEILKNLKFSKI